MRTLAKLALLLIVAGIVERCSSHRILAIYPMPIKSHFILISKLLKGLADAGHRVDLISDLPPNERHPNYTRIIALPPVELAFLNASSYDMAKNFRGNLSMIGDLGYKMCENMGAPEFLQLARNPPRDRPYDVLVTHMMNYHCYAILAHLWNIPLVLVSTTSMYPWMHDMIGNPENVAFSPNNMVAVPIDNNFWTRLKNAYLFHLLKFTYLHYTANQNELLRKYFGADAPTIRQLESSVSLVLQNTYFPINGVKPMTKGVVEIGGLHIQKDSLEISSDLKKWLDESKKGVIYFSFGSMFRLETFPKEIVEVIFSTLEKVAPVRVLMKIARPEELPVKIPSNFHTLPWIPQQKVLQHPNVKVFVTHGGLLGTQEATYFGVPMLCMPLLADQWTNANNYVSKKIAVTVNVMSLTQEEYDKAVDELLNNPSYRENMKRISRLFRDRPQSAMDTARYWIEYVVRNGKDSLRSPAMDLRWWQVALLDVYAFIALGLAIALSMVFFVAKLLLRLIFSTSRNVVLSEKKHN